MKITKMMIKTVTTLAILTIATAVRSYAGTVYTGDAGRFEQPDTERPVQGQPEMVEKEISHVHFRCETNGVPKVSFLETRIFPLYADSMSYGTPQVGGGCATCNEISKTNLPYFIRTFFEEDDGYELYSRSGTVLSHNDLYSSGYDFDNLSHPIRLGMELDQDPKVICPSCGRKIGDIVTIDKLTYRIKTVVFISHPCSVTAAPGDNASFNFKLLRYIDKDYIPQNYYKWQRNVNGTWENINDGAGSWGETYYGSSTTELRIRNVSAYMKDMKVRCELNGTFGQKVYTDTVYINMPSVTSVPTPSPTASPTPPPATPSPTVVPASPTPTVVPATPTPHAPTPSPVIPSGGGKTEYRPSSSSSSYTPQPSSSSSAPGRSSSTSAPRPGSGETVYKGEIPGHDDGRGDEKIPAANEGSTGGRSGGTSGSSSKTGPSSRSGSSSDMTGSSSVTRQTGSGNYVTKNGVLYLIDDEDTGIGPEDPASQPESVETEDRPNMYEAGDLAVDGEYREQEYEKGFFSTNAGYATIAVSALLLTALAIFFLFFGVIVFGEVEEHDEVFEFCAVRLMRRRDGNWYVNLGNSFDDNAVLKLRIGLLFAVIFEEWDVIGEVGGTYEGQVKGQVEQGMLLYRRSIRRIV